MSGTDFKLLRMSRKIGRAAVPSTPTRGASTKRQSRREAILAEAALAFNARGIAGTSINDIAAKLELPRAAVYYYVDDRDDLVFQTYLRSCELAADDLEAAYEDAESGLDRLIGYVRRALDAERETSAVLSEIPYLSGPTRAVVEKANKRNIDAIRRFIRDGIADRSIRDCDADVAANTIVGLLSWAPLWPAWIGGAGKTASTFRQTVANASVELLTDGIAADPNVKVRCPIDVETFRPRPANVFDRRDAQAMKMDQIAITASRLFNRQGIDGTSLDQICEVLGATKGALYHYFADKQELVLHCYRRGFDLFETFVDTAAHAGRSGLERGVIGLHLNVQAQAGELSPLMPQPGLDVLPARERTRITQRAAAIEQKFEAFGRQGRVDGSHRDCDLNTISLVGAGVFAWVPKWFEPSDTRAVWRTADETADFFIRGLRRR